LLIRSYVTGLYYVETECTQSCSS